MNKSNLCLHCGASRVDRNALALVETPAPTETWLPIPHARMLEEVEKALTKHNMTIVEESFGLTSDKGRMFGLLQVANHIDTKDYAYVVGLRNSIDKSLPAGLAVGSSVFVCDNLAFSSEIVFGRKHTKNILDDLPVLVDTAIGKLGERWTDQAVRFEAYKHAPLTNKEAMVLLVEAADAEVFPWTRGWDILQEWKKPSHSEFADRNVWSFFNAVTEHLKPRAESKGTSLWSMPSRCGRLHSICDTAAGISLVKSEIEVPSPVVVPAVN